MQRAFAVEFLSPITGVQENLGGYFSEDSQHEAVEHFRVPPMAVHAQLVNHGVVDREDVSDIMDRDGSRWSELHWRLAFLGAGGGQLAKHGNFRSVSRGSGTAVIARNPQSHGDGMASTSSINLPEVAL